MKTKSLFILIIGILIYPTLAAGDSESKPQTSVIANIIRNIKVRQTTSDQNAIEKPASLQFVHSNQSNGDSYSIDLGITYERFQLGIWALSPTFEYHRNTLIAKSQNNLQGGIALSTVWGDVANSEFTLIPQFSAKYKYDKFNTNDAMIAKIDFPMLKPNWAMGVRRGPKLFHLVWLPTAGLQYEWGENIRATNYSGKLIRAVGNLEVAFDPFWFEFKKNIEFILRSTYWYNIDRSSILKDAVPVDQHLNYVGFLLYFDDNEHCGVGIEYSNGENPEQGLAKQETTTISLKLY